MQTASQTRHDFRFIVERKLCVLPSAVPCKGYGECVLRKWLADGKLDCFDGSDEGESKRAATITIVRSRARARSSLSDPQYANIFQSSEHLSPHIHPHIVLSGRRGGNTSGEVGAQPPQRPPSLFVPVPIVAPPPPPLPPPPRPSLCPPYLPTCTPIIEAPLSPPFVAPPPPPSIIAAPFGPSPPPSLPQISLPQRSSPSSWSSSSSPPPSPTSPAERNEPKMRKETLYPTPRASAAASSPPTSLWPTHRGGNNFETTKEYFGK